MNCTETGCERSRHGRGLCKLHYQQAYRAKRLPPELKARTVQEALDMRTEWINGCLIWTGSKLRGGYGSLNIKGKEQQAHRAVYAEVHGPIPDGMRVDHKCHNSSCVNIEHLRLATHKQNVENIGGLQKTNTTGFRGVTRERSGRFRAQIGHNKQRMFLGTYATAEEAGAVAKAKRLELFTHNDLDRMAA